MCIYETSLGLYENLTKSPLLDDGRDGQEECQSRRLITRFSEIITATLHYIIVINVSRNFNHFTW